MRLCPNFHGRGAALEDYSCGSSCATFDGIITGRFAPSAFIRDFSATSTATGGISASPAALGGIDDDVDDGVSGGGPVGTDGENG